MPNDRDVKVFKDGSERFATLSELFWGRAQSAL